MDCIKATLQDVLQTRLESKTVARFSVCKASQRQKHNLFAALKKPSNHSSRLPIRQIMLSHLKCPFNTRVGKTAVQCIFAQLRDSLRHSIAVTITSKEKRSSLLQHAPGWLFKVPRMTNCAVDSECLPPRTHLHCKVQRDTSMQELFIKSKGKRMTAGGSILSHSRCILHAEWFPISMSFDLSVMPHVSPVNCRVCAFRHIKSYCTCQVFAEVCQDSNFIDYDPAAASFGIVSS